MQPSTVPVRAYHIMTKPVGPICNLDCTYCFYLEKERLYPSGEKWKMSLEVLESYIRQYIESQNVPEIGFAWQGGEPTLLGVEFFRTAVELQKKYSQGKKIQNAFQTNGVLLDAEWCQFLHENEFLVGLSIDGPKEIHDRYRLDKQGQPTFDKVMAALDLLKAHRVEFNTLTVVNRHNSQYPLEIYRFLKQIGSTYHQFIPLVERLPGAVDQENSNPLLPILTLAEPPALGSIEPPLPVTPWSVEPKAYGEFLVRIFDEWVRQDVGRVYVQHFDVALNIWVGNGSTICVFSETCGKAMALEHNGDLYACDHFVYPKFKLGNLMNDSLGSLVESAPQIKFGRDKADTLPMYCRSCEVKFACQGECPKHRFIRTPSGEPGLNYLCSAYKRFFRHIDPHMRVMTELLKRQQPPAMIMDLLRQQEGRDPGDAGRNDPCPCGSGKKVKKCCGAGLA